jgi:hypothetical protein
MALKCILKRSTDHDVRYIFFPCASRGFLSAGRNNSLSDIKQLISVTNMAKRVVRADDEEGLQKLFDSDNEVSDLSFSDSDSEELQEVVESESTDESDDNDECAPAPSKRGRSEWDWKQIDNNPVIIPFNVYSGVCEDLLHKYKSQQASQLHIFSNIWGHYSD